MSAEVFLPKGDVQIPAKVMGCKQNRDANPIGVAHSNPMLDTRVYEITFPNGHTKECAANVIVENIYSQVDVDGNRLLLLKAIMDHHKDDTAIAVDDNWIQHGIYRSLRCTTQGWQLKVLWRDDTTS